MLRLGIVSSYDRRCGIAHYVSTLRPHLARFCEVTVLPLDVDLLHSEAPEEVKLGDEHIRRLAAHLSQFDVINIHIEHGLFGSTTSHIRRRLITLFEAAPSLCLTVHWFTPDHGFRTSDYFNDLRGLNFSRFGLRLYQQWNHWQMDSSLYGSVLRRLQNRRPVSVIVHNTVDRDRLTQKYGLSGVFDHPLAYLSPEDVSAIHADSSRSLFPPIAALPTNVKLAGVFGFFASYKGFEVAIRALKYLGPEHHLALFGDLAQGQTDMQYKNLLVREAEAFQGRVHFCGAQPDELFFKAIACCDTILMPYREVGLSSSGPISLALDLRKPVVASRVRAFEGLASYYPDTITFFQTGDEEDLAKAIRSQSINRPDDQFHISPFERNLETYRKAISGLIGR